MLESWFFYNKTNIKKYLPVSNMIFVHSKITLVFCYKKAPKIDL